MVKLNACWNTMAQEYKKRVVVDVIYVHFDIRALV